MGLSQNSSTEVIAGTQNRIQKLASWTPNLCLSETAFIQSLQQPVLDVTSGRVSQRGIACKLLAWRGSKQQRNKF